ncbi:MAG: hypothetical protein R2752_15515 [Vicinamibacterales bacterium]
MAKRGQGNRTGDTAVTIGKAFGRVAAKVDALKRQRAAVAAEIQSVIHAAQRLLADLGGSGSAAKSGGTAGTRRKPRLSPEARERIAEAQRRRWAKVRAAKSAKAKK